MALIAVPHTNKVYIDTSKKIDVKPDIQTIEDVPLTGVKFIGKYRTTNGDIRLQRTVILNYDSGMAYPFQKQWTFTKRTYILGFSILQYSFKPLGSGTYMYMRKRDINGEVIANYWGDAIDAVGQMLNTHTYNFPYPIELPEGVHIYGGGGIYITLYCYEEDS